VEKRIFTGHRYVLLPVVEISRDAIKHGWLDRFFGHCWSLGGIGGKVVPVPGTGSNGSRAVEDTMT
jgi:hypothetical protein